MLEGEAHAQLLFDTDQAESLMREILDFLNAEPPFIASAPLLPASRLRREVGSGRAI